MGQRFDQTIDIFSAVVSAVVAYLIPDVEISTLLSFLEPEI
jgi:hypothetical protein